MSTLAQLFNINTSPIKASGLWTGKRIPDPPPDDTNESSAPGHLCWGSVGSLPNGELAPSVGFKTSDCHEVHTEVSRTTEKERIENPEEPENWVETDRAQSMRVNKTEKRKGQPANTTAGIEGKFVVSNGFSGLAAGGGGASVTKRTRPWDQAVGPRPDARAGGALPAR